ncbi:MULTISPECIES: hypothetical protein [Nocardioides]|uniref:PrsW family intramembrane metalloprotease n=1 Tax=Nocardioides vastitatis TaxID=2568655 RepID=A0ABW0ZQQ4_9ACTN|nr:hypothetical protein [Nocardioides sp.]THJ05733.1 hypothetical protein E7Z54_07165 [Nocardioides sp.]
MLRAAVLLGSGSTSFEIIRQVSERMPVHTVPSWMDSMVQPIATVDVLAALVGALEYAGRSRHFDVGGPDQLRYGALLEAYTVHAGLKRPQVNVPLLPTALVGTLVGSLTDVPRAMVEALVESLHHDMIAADDDFREVLLPRGHRLVGLADAFRRSLASGGSVPEDSDPMGPLPQDPAWASGGDDRPALAKVVDTVKMFRRAEISTSDRSAPPDTTTRRRGCHVEGAVPVLTWVRRALWDVVPRDHREPSTARRHRLLTILSVAVVGAVVLGFALRVEPGSASFYWWTLVLAGVWVIGAFAAGPLHLGRIRSRSGFVRPIVTPIVVGLVLVALFVVGGLVVREIPALDAQVRHVLVFADEGALPLVVLVTAVNGIAEKLFFRGALYAAVTRHPVAVTTFANALVVLAAGNLMLTLAAVLLAVVVGCDDARTDRNRSLARFAALC